MGRVETYPEGSFCWVDLGTTDMEAARRFYAGLFGWELVDRPDTDGTYTVARLGGLDVCGMHQRADGDEGWSSYIAVADVERTRARAQELGATAVGEITTSPGVARTATLRDPVGAQVALWQQIGFHGAGVVNEVGTWNWNELVTTDLDRAADFYSALFGWHVRRQEGPLERSSFHAGERLVAGAHAPTPGDPEIARWSVSFRVARVEEAVRVARSLGGTVVLPPLDIPIGRLAIVADAAGATLTVTEFGDIVGGVDRV